MVDSQSRERTELYTPAESAAVLGVSRQRVLQWIDQGVISAIRLGSGRRTMRVHRVELERFIEEDFDPDIPPGLGGSLR